VIAALPGPLRRGSLWALSLLLHVPIKLRERHQERWRFRNTLHAVYDFFGPRYAHRHGFNEVVEWFEEEGFAVQVQSPMRYRQLFGKQLHGVGLLGRRRGPSPD